MAVSALQEIEKATKRIDEINSARQMAEYLLEQSRASGNPRAASAAKIALQKASDEELAIRSSIPKLLEMAQQQKQEQEKFLANKKNALQQLSSGSYKAYTEQPAITPEGIPMGYTTPVEDIARTRRNAQALIAQALDAPVESVDVESGLTAGDRAILQAIPTDEERAQVLIGKYGEENVSSINIDGKNTLIVKKQNGQIVPVDEMGTSIKDLVDFGAKALVEAPKVGAATLLGVLTAPSVIGSSFATSGAYSGVGAGEDALIRSALGLDINAGEIASRRVPEFIMGVPIDAVTMGTGKFIARRAGKPIKNEMLDELSKAQQTLAKSGIETEVPVAAAFGEAGLKKTKEIAGKYTNSPLARRLKRNQEALVEMMHSLVNRKPSREGYENLVKGIQQEAKDLALEVAGRDIKAKKLVEDFALRQQEKAQVTRYDRSQIGKKLRAVLDDSKDFETQEQTAAFQGIYDAADRAGFSVKPEEIANFIRRRQLETRGMPIENRESKEIVDMLYGADEAAYEAKMLREKMAGDPVLAADESVMLTLQELEKKAAPKGLADLHAMRQQISDAIADGGAPGAGVKSNTAQKLNQYLNEFIDSKLGSFDQNLANAWRDTNLNFDEKMAFGRGSVGKILRTKLGGSALTPEAMADVAIRSRTDAADILGAVAKYDAETGNSLEPQIRTYLQSAYLDKLGVTKRKGIAPQQVKHDSEIIDVLFGNGTTGSGKRYADKLDRLNMALYDAKINPSSIDASHVSKLFQSLDQQTERGIIKQIVAKEQALQAQERLFASRVVQLATKGSPKRVPTDRLAEAFMNDSTPVRDITKVMRGKMTKPEREQLKQDTLQYFFERYSNGDRVATPSASQLWDAGKFLRDAKTSEGRRFAQKMRTILGSDTYDKLYAASVMADASQIPTKTSPGAMRMTGGPDREKGLKGNVYFAGNLVDSVKSRLLAVAYGQKMLDPIISGLAKNVGEVEMERRVGAAFARAITTSKGLQLIANEATKDPEFAVDIMDYMNRVAELEDQQ